MNNRIAAIILGFILIGSTCYFLNSGYPLFALIVLPFITETL